MSVDFEQPQKQVVLLIHGTFANDDNDCGDKWWQVGSSLADQLQGQLPPHIRLHQKHEVFHWSGNNSERSRWIAAKRLLEHLEQFDGQEIPVHLIGHSHGGSVIWRMLQLATRDRKSLPTIQSWTTVGTPFLQFRPSWRVYLLFPVAVVLLFTSLIMLFTFLMLSADEFAQTSPWLPFGIGIATLLSGVTIAARLDETVGMHKGNEQLSLQLYGHSWRGLWSPEDEAINALQSSLKSSRSIMPRRPIEVPERVFRSDSWLLLTLPIAWTVNICMNRIAPLGDRFIVSRLRKSFQGDDRPGPNVSDVCTGPVATLQCPPIPMTISKELVESADTHAAQAIAELRLMLAQYANPTESEGAGGLGNNIGLVHTSYFGNMSIVRLLGLRVSESAGVPLSLDDSLCKWLSECGIAVDSTSTPKEKWWGRLFFQNLVRQKSP